MTGLLQRKFFVRWGLPLFMGASATLLLFAALILAAHKADETARSRQIDLLRLIVDTMTSSVAHDQESATVWDDAVQNVGVNDQAWMDANLGAWMHSYFGHDAAVILSPQDQLIFAYIADPGNPAVTLNIVDTARPLAERLRLRLRQGEQPEGTETLSIGESDIREIGGRAAIVSVKPIVSDSGEVGPPAGEEYLHVAIRYLDGGFVERIAAEYQFADLAFVRNGITSSRYLAFPVRTRAGDTIGFFRWQPFSPGASVIASVSPFIVAVGVGIVLLTSILGSRLWQRTRHLAASQLELRHLAMHDPLTGLANRTTFKQELEERLSLSKPGVVHAVLFIDLDHFKAVNDTHGHPIGDKLIKQVATRLIAVAPNGLVCRLGGDEFTLLLTLEDPHEAEQMAEQVVSTLHEPFLIDGLHLQVGASVGVAFSSDGMEAADLTRHADIALYHAKAAGRNAFAIFGAHMEELLRRRRKLEEALRQALMDGTGIEVCYQPVYATSDGAVRSLEALCRWRHPELGSIPPDVFIPIAEEAGLIQPLGQFVMNDACSLLAEISGSDVTIAVNASVIELMAPGYPLRVLDTLARHGIDPRRLEIEITESVATDSGGRAAAAIALLRSVGVRFAVDDFGKGNSSFGQLLNLEVDRIKIDKIFIEGLSSPDGRPLIEAIVNMARHKGLKTTAEGVETLEQLEALTTLGCDNLQGFQLSEPLRRDSVADLFGSAEKRASIG